MLHNAIHLAPKRASYKFNCEICDYYGNNRANFNRHLSTTKHKMLSKCYKKVQKRAAWVCPECEKCYYHRSSYYRHMRSHKNQILEGNPLLSSSKKADISSSEVSETDILRKELEFMRSMMKDLITTTREMVPKVGNNISINVFLNETCKDAMNLTDFVNKIRVSLEDLTKTKQMGYVDGISNILLKNLEGVPTSVRPFHCSDIKRLQFYVKDENKWDKDDGKKMGEAIHEVAIKQIKKIKDWERKHPDFLGDEDLMKEWQLLIQNTIGGVTETDREKNKKDVIKNVGENVILKEAIDKV